MSKIKIAVSWNSSCGGCDESIVDIEEKILDVAEKAEFVFWPCAMDFKYSDLDKFEEKEIAVALINGGIQNSEQYHVVKKLRNKSELIVAFGSCACFGGIPSLANLTSVKEIFNVSYINSPTVVNPEGVWPKSTASPDGYDLSLPKMFSSVYKLDDVIKVDYFLPGCPPTAELIIKALEAILSGNLPERGSVLAPDTSLCRSCNRNNTKPENILIERVKRIHQIEADPEICFLAQDVLCMGPVSRDGCDYPCIRGNMPCTGCMGPVSSTDQGAEMVGLLGAILSGDSEELADPAGTFYRYSVAASFLGRKRKEN